MPKQDDFLIILGSVPGERQAETALFLSGCFSLPISSTKGIVAAGPIALLVNLPRGRADSILEAMTASLPAGVDLQIVSGEDAGKVSRLQWPRQPRVYGRELSEYDDMADSEISCPHCGGRILVSRDDAGFKTVPVRESRRIALGSANRQSPADKEDPLFSGIKPLVGADADLASLKSLEAGDTGFWMDYGNKAFSPPSPPEAVADNGKDKDSSQGKKSNARNVAGLAAFMKPGGFALVISRTKDGQAVKMIAEIMGINEDEARDRCLNLGTCVARDIALDEAQNLLARFRGLGAKARIVRPS